MMTDNELATVEDAVELSQKLVRLHRSAIASALEEVGAEKVSLLPPEDAVEYLLWLLHYIAETEEASFQQARQRAASIPATRKPPRCSVCDHIPCQSPTECNAVRRQRRKEYTEERKAKVRAKAEKQRAKAVAKRIAKEDEAIERKLGETQATARLMQQKPVPPAFYPSDHKPAPTPTQRRRKAKAMEVQRNLKEKSND